VGNWLLAQAKDRSLFEFLNVDVENVMSRKGLIDVNALHSTWDTQLILLKNGKKFKIQSPGQKRGPVVENMDKFTWYMTLVVAGLDAALTSKSVHLVVSTFMIQVTEEAVSGSEFVEREVLHHIQGWRSAAAVRGISLKARKIWESLAGQGLHWPGMIPPIDCGELKRLLIWVAAERGEHYYTKSRDAYCFALILRGIGIDMLVDEATDQAVAQCFHEGRIHVVLSNAPGVLGRVSRGSGNRRGMRVPLNSMEESISLWPGGRELTNSLRIIFEDGYKTCKADNIVFIPFYDTEVPYSAAGAPFHEEDIDMRYIVKATTQIPIPRLSGDVNRLIKACLPLETPTAVKELERLCRTLPVKEFHDIMRYIDSYAINTDTRHTLAPDLNDSLAKLQTFILGYYYAFLRPLVDASELSINEGYGAWRWYDMELFELLRSFVATRHHRKINAGKDNVYFFYRHETLKILAFFFAGADLDQLENVKTGTLGVIGKLSIMNSALLGCVTEPEHIGKFHLLDIDPTCIPSSAGGIISSGRTGQRIVGFAQSLKRLQQSEVDSCAGSLDFTTHIEPDWDRDDQTCLLTYRHNGRIVHRVNPRQVDIMMFREFLKLDEKNIWGPIGGIQTKTSVPEANRQDSLVPVSLDEFHGATRIWPKVSDNPWRTLSDTSRGQAEPNPGKDVQLLLIPTKGLPKAFTCIKTLYEGWNDENKLDLISPPISPDLDPSMRHPAIIVILST
jgi:hypothetical protein